MHKTVLSAEYMLREILKRARLISKHRPLPASPALSFFLRHEGAFNTQADMEEVLEHFGKLDDYDVMTAVKLWCDDPDFVLSELCKRLINRKLFRIEISQEPFNPDYIDTVLKRIAEKYQLGMYDASFMLLQGVSSNHAYHPKKPAINILYKDGTVKDIGEASDQLNISVLSQPVVKYFICYPKEIEV